MAPEDLAQLQRLWDANEQARQTYNRWALVVAGKFNPTHDRYVELADGFAVISVPKKEFNREARDLGMITGGAR